MQQKMAHQGFTLLELMIAVVILSILAAIAYPSYQDQVRKTRRVDGKSAVLEMAMAEEQFYTRNRRYTNDPDKLSVDAALKKKRSKEGYYSLTLSANTTSFVVTATATGAQADDTDCLTLSMNQKGEKKSTGKSTSGKPVSTSGCW